MWHAERTIVVTVNPTLAEAKRLEASVNIRGRIIQFMGPLLFFPDINPRGPATILKIINVMPKGAQAEQILKYGPRLTAQAGKPYCAREDDGHADVIRDA